MLISSSPEEAWDVLIGCVPEEVIVGSFLLALEVRKQICNAVIELEKGKYQEH